MKANLNPTFRKELKGKTMLVDFNESFMLTPYELNQIRFWLKRKHDKELKLPLILPVSKRFVLDFIGWENPEHNDVILGAFRKSFFNY